MIIAFIPARGGSKSIPKKNIKLFCNKPLIYWSLLALERSSKVDLIYVATDDDEIKSTVMSFNFNKVIIYDRDPENATDFASTESVILEFLGKHYFDENDLFILVQATNPFITSEDIDNAIEQLIKQGSDSMLSCVRIKRFLWNDDGTPLNYDFMMRPRRQDFHGILVENGAFYINRVGNIKKYKNRLSGKIAIYEMKEYSFFELDEEDDWIIAEKLMYKHILSKRSIPIIKLFLSDVDGTLTDGGIYYGENGEELKKFNTKDGMGFELLRKAGIKTGLITRENSKIVELRAKKLQVDYLYMGVKDKFSAVREICEKENISLENVAYIGDDINCKEVLLNVGLSACPADAAEEIKNIPNIIKLSKEGGKGAVREFIDIILGKCYA